MVLVNGTNIYRHFEAVINDIGFVPQRDIIHNELSVYQALDYAAKLRSTQTRARPSATSASCRCWKISTWSTARTVAVEEIGPCKKKVSVEIPEETIKEMADEQYRELRREAVLPGLPQRPARLLEKRFGKETTADVRNAHCWPRPSEAVEKYP